MVEYVAVACAACGMCQVQQDKKASKWKCVVCGARQTLQKVLARGASRELRSVVQELNMTRGQAAAESPPPPQGEGFGCGEATGVRGLDVPKEAAPEGGWGEFLDGRGGGGGQVSDEESEAGCDALPQPPAAPRAAASRRASRSSRSSALTARSSGGGDGGAAAAAAAMARKRRFEESEVELLARRPDAEREWKRQRLTPSTPCQSPQLAGLNGGACGGGGGGYAVPSPQKAFPASACVAYAQEQQPAASLYPRWTVGRQGEASSPPPSLPPPPSSSAAGCAGSVLELQSGLGSMSLVGGMEGRVQSAKSSSAAPWADFLDDDDEEEGSFGTNNRGQLLA